MPESLSWSGWKFSPTAKTFHVRKRTTNFHLGTAQTRKRYKQRNRTSAFNGRILYRRKNYIYPIRLFRNKNLTLHYRRLRAFQRLDSIPSTGVTHLHFLGSIDLAGTPTKPLEPLYHTYEAGRCNLASADATVGIFIYCIHCDYYYDCEATNVQVLNLQPVWSFLFFLYVSFRRQTSPGC
jgi:hypothetical protein